MTQICTHPNHMVHGIHITFSHVNTNCTQSETILLSRAVNNYWGAQTCDCHSTISVWRRISGRRIRWHGVWRNGASKWTTVKIICGKNENPYEFFHDEIMQAIVTVTGVYLLIFIYKMSKHTSFVATVLSDSLAMIMLILAVLQELLACFA